MIPVQITLIFTLLHVFFFPFFAWPLYEVPVFISCLCCLALCSLSFSLSLILFLFALSSVYFPFSGGGEISFCLGFAGPRVSQSFFAVAFHLSSISQDKLRWPLIKNSRDITSQPFPSSCLTKCQETEKRDNR